MFASLTKKQKDEALLNRFPLADRATILSIQKDVQNRLLSLAKPLLQKEKNEILNDQRLGRDYEISR